MEDILVVNVLEDGHLRKRAALVSLKADSTRRAYTYSFIERLFHVGVVRSLLVAFAQDLVDVCGQQFWRLGSRGGDSVVVAVLLACLQTIDASVLPPGLHWAWRNAYPTKCLAKALLPLECLLDNVGILLVNR